MGAPVLSPIDGVSYGSPMYAADDGDTSLGYSDGERRVNMQEALRAYKGRLPYSLKPKAKQPKELAMRTNRCRTIVDVGVAFLFGQEVRFAVNTGDAASAAAAKPGGKPGAKPEKGSDPVQDNLDACWDANKKALALEAIAVNGAIFGNTYVKVMEDGVMKDGQKFPRLVVLDPTQVTVETDPDDCMMPVAFNICWQGVDANKKVVHRRQRIERTDLPHIGQDAGYDDEGVPLGAPETWTIQNQIKVGSNSSGQDRWQNVGAAMEWPYGWCPIHACSNLPEPNTYYGAPDLTPDLIELQKALNFALSNRSTILYHHAHPKTWGRGFQSSEMAMSPDDVTVIQSETGMLQNLELNGAGLAALDTHIRDIRSDMDELSAIPGVATGRIEAMLKGAVPGITIRMEFQPLLTKTQKKQQTYGDLLEQLNSHILEMLGHGMGIDVDCLWQDPLPVNMAEWATFAPVVNSMGGSKQTLLAMVGLDYDQEQERKQIEDAAQADVAQQAMANFDAGKTPGAQGLMPVPEQMPPEMGTGDGMPGAQMAKMPSPAVAAAALQHPAMQAQRAAAIATAGGGGQ